MKNQPSSRRQFLKSMLSSAAGVSLLSSSQLAFQSKSFASSVNDYKALVGVFLYGGNDGFNMLVPLQNETLSNYQQVRTHLTQVNPLPISPSVPITDGIGLAQPLASLQPLFQQGKLAIQARVGTLIEPVMSGALIPAGLLSHSNQQEAWQRGAELNQGIVGGTGWAGRVLDHLALSHDQEYLMNMSLQGRNLWQAGNQVSPYAVSTDSVNAINAFSLSGLGARSTPIMKHYFDQTQHHHKIMEHFRKAINHTDSSSQWLGSALESLPASEAEALFPNGNHLADQLKQVLKLIRLGQQQQIGRQIFLVGMGGFDTHRGQRARHDALLNSLSEALAAFYQATEQLNVSDQVTTFTLSDFGRSRVPNSSGTDHGWASHQFILGGAVRGDLYGDLPSWSLSEVGETDTVPTTANEQMFASLAHWFGVPEQDCFDIFPNLANFGPSLQVDYFQS